MGPTSQFNTLPYNYGLNYAQPQYNGRSQFNYGYQQQFGQPLRAAAPLYTPTVPVTAAPAAAPVATPLYTATAPVASVAQPRFNNFAQPMMMNQGMMNNFQSNTRFAQPAYNTVGALPYANNFAQPAYGFNTGYGYNGYNGLNTRAPLAPLYGR